MPCGYPKANAEWAKKLGFCVRGLLLLEREILEMVFKLFARGEARHHAGDIMGAGTFGSLGGFGFEFQPERAKFAALLM